MKKTFKKVAATAIIAVATIVTAVTFQSCNQEAESVSSAETKLTTEQAFAKDLQRLANAQRKFARQLSASSFSRRAGSVPTDSLGIPDDCQDAAQEVVEIISEIAQNYDLTEDLTEHEKEGLAIDEETLEMMALDTDAFFDYIGEYKSKEFNNIVLYMFENPNYSLSIDGIIQNENLKMNEKVDLIIQAVTDEYIRVDEPEQPMGPDGLYVSSCDERLQADLLDCAQDFRVNLLGVLWNIVRHGMSTAKESYKAANAQLANCRNSANKEYNHCKNRKK